MYYVKVGGRRCHVIQVLLSNKNKIQVWSCSVKSLYLNFAKFFWEVITL